MPTTVVFDVDDTLYLERDYVASGFRAVDDWVRTHHGVACFFETAWRTFTAGGRGHIFDDVLAQLEVHEPAPLIPQMVNVYRRHAPAIELLPDARAALDVLRTRAKLAVITDGPLHSQEAKVNALGLHSIASPIICTASLGPGMGKPHPSAFRMIEDVHENRGDGCVYVADNPIKDFEAPRGLGWRTIRVRRAEGLHFSLDSGDDVDAELPDLDELPQIL